MVIYGIFSPQGFFVPYLTGGISIVVLALGSTAPGLLGFFINKFSAVFPDYRERVLGHEAAHFLVRPARSLDQEQECSSSQSRHNHTLKGHVHSVEKETI